MTTFKASEVRHEATQLPDSNGRVEVAAMLHAYADRIEADEKAVPVAYAEFADNGCVRMWSRGYEERLPGTRMIPLYTHPSPSDAERLTSKLTDLDARDSFTVHTDTTTLQRNANAGSPPSVRFGDETPMTHYLPTPTNDSERLAEALSNAREYVQECFDKEKVEMAGYLSEKERWPVVATGNAAIERDKAEAELAALKAKVVGSPLVPLTKVALGNGYSLTVSASMSVNDVDALHGKRVHLVVEE